VQVCTIQSYYVQGCTVLSSAGAGRILYLISFEPIFDPPYISLDNTLNKDLNNAQLTSETLATNRLDQLKK
jgi:hypothetical protein